MSSETPQQPLNFRFSRAPNGVIGAPSSASSPSSSSSSSLPDTHIAAIRSFLHQKPHRIQQRLLIRKVTYTILTGLAMLLAWAIGYWGWSVVFLVGLFLLMTFVWKDLSKRFTAAAQQEIEMTVRRKKALQLSESAEWVNMAINRWWMTCNESVFGFIKDYIEPLLQEVTPRGIDNLELIEFDLSNQTPFVKSIHVFDPPSSLISSLLPTDSNILQSSTTNNSSSSNANKAFIVANVDVGLVAPDSKLVLKARVGGKRIGYDTLVHIEGLHLSGNVQAILLFDYEAPFPHVGWISATFTRKPELWFSIRVLKGLKVTDIPIVKSFVHSLIMSIFQSLLVDPGRLEIDLMSSGPKSTADHQSSRRARGVLTVTFTGNPPQKSSKYESDSRRWVTFCLGSQKHKIQLPTGQESWKTTYSFFVYDVKEDVLIIKVKHYRVMYTMTLAMHTVSLNALNLVNESGEEFRTNRYISVGNSETNISLDIDYTPLPPFSLNYSLPVPPSDQVAGVLYIHVHSALGLRSGDMDGLSDPYCVVLVNKKKVLTTHYILDTLEPKWERGIEIFVSDFTQVSLTFAVYDWDGPLVGDDLLGTCKMTLEADKPYILHKELELEIDGSPVLNGASLGLLSVSVVFRDVESVSNADVEGSGIIKAHSVLTHSSSADAASKMTSKQAWKKLKGLGGILPGENFGILELSVVEGRNLKAMDRNGFSDPYIVVKYGVHEMYRTPSVSKSLNPKWNCHCTLSAPPPDTSIILECWDKDQFTSDDFMGSLAFTLNDLKLFENGPVWCPLQHVSSGEIRLEFKKSDTLRGNLQDNASFGNVSLEESSREPAEDSDNESSHGHTVPYITYGDSGVPSPSRSMSPSYSSPHLVSHTPPPPHPLPSSSSNGSSLDPRLSPVPVPERGNLTSRHKSKSGSLQHFSNHRHSITPSVGSGDSSISTHSASLLGYSISGDTPEREIRRRGDKGGHRHSMFESSTTIPHQTSVFYNVSGEIIDVEGLKGKLDHLMLYIKVRLNSRPSHLRRQKFDRGPLLHKTQSTRGSSSVSFNEAFVVKDSPISTDSLMSIDLKSGPNVTLGTHVITLDKFFEGNLRATKWLDLGNNMKIRMKLSHCPPHARSIDASFNDTL
ncbi:PREDICTED: uncharacterized protein LOC100638002 [Amphimedon queenslandica]|uniref:Uncharacterized protein n=1 Tax=Amphimedon queenslandica TaxID=400682 RepID=A0A1X7V484_AMPQE|nr:PREDICTED: uncharacterized protein LOC100638002 [Amphimedon queenslandica]|eukprot:XP_003385799.1 PREDICTED: uncharacterized protein LOC100638002 [Amphimedon queenslandica]